MRIVSIKQIDVREIVGLWNESLGNDFPMTEELWLQNTINDRNVLDDGSIGIYQGAELTGFVVAKLYQEDLSASMQRDMGWIQCLFVKAKYRNGGIGKQLLNHAEKVLLARGVREIRLGRDPWHYFPGVPKENEATIQWFEKNGYQIDSVEVDLLKEVKEREYLPLLTCASNFRLLENRDLPKLIEFLEEVFPGRWHYEALRYLDYGDGREFIGLFIENELKGFCRINDPDSPIIAQNLYWSELFNGKLGGIGPLGIDRAIRGKHYGIDLVKAATNELISRGMDHIVIDWTQLVEFYGKLGYSPWKRYAAMSKSMEKDDGK